ncbi:hypothetical protein CY34DRAFT_60117, partial [Suillus luteus UH-Slu-Lm8-n1]
LNSIAIKNATSMPYVKLFTKQSARCVIYSIINLFVRCDHRTLAEESCDLMMFQTPLG